MLPCPICNKVPTVKNGHISNSKQRYLCKGCGYQFVEGPQQILIGEEKRALIGRLLLERLSLAGICRAVGVSEAWLQGYVNKKISGSEAAGGGRATARGRHNAGAGMR